jgi:hypothetical protein
MGEVKGVEQCSIDDHAGFGALDGELRDEGEMEFSSTIGEELGESVADLRFVIEVKLSDLIERGVVVLDRGMGRFEG